MRFRDTLILFAKAPRICRVKTRLWPALSHRECLYFHRQALRQLFLKFANKQHFNFKVYATGSLQRFSLPYITATNTQSGNDLGIRMHNAIQQELRCADRVVIIGSDCIQVNAAYIRAAFDCMTSKKDLVLGAANDGGYVLIGASKASRALFNNTQWGSSSVYESTSNNARALGFNVHTLPTMIDVDTIEDLTIMKEQDSLPAWAKKLV